MKMEHQPETTYNAHNCDAITIIIIIHDDRNTTNQSTVFNLIFFR